MNNGPEEASADMRVFAKSCRQMYIALTSEGFTDQQSFAIIGAMIVSNINKGDTP